MLKKVGIVVAAAAAGLLAVGPLAFAGNDEDGDVGYGQYEYGSESDRAETESDSNLAGSETGFPLVGCNNDPTMGVDVGDITADAGIFGEAEARSDEDVADGQGQRTCDEHSGSGEGSSEGSSQGINSLLSDLMG